MRGAGACGSRGIVLLIVALLLSLLVIVATLFVRLSGTRRSVHGIDLTRARARLLSASGLDYAVARLRANPEPVSNPARSAANAGDDWIRREDPSVPLAQALNPSYSNGERWTDTAPVDGAQQAAEPWSERYPNGFRDVFSGRLRSLYVRQGDRFLLDVSGLNSRIDVNGGELRDLVATHPDFQRYFNDVSDTNFRPATGAEHADPAYPANLATVRILNNLGAHPSIGLPTLGETVVRNRPQAGYVTLEQVRSRCALPAGAFEFLRPRLACTPWRNRSMRRATCTDCDANNVSFELLQALGGINLPADPDPWFDNVVSPENDADAFFYAEPRAPLDLNLADRAVLEAALSNLVASYVTDDGYVQYPNFTHTHGVGHTIVVNANRNPTLDPSTGAPFEDAPIRITRNEAALLAGEILVERSVRVLRTWPQIFAFLHAVRDRVFTGNEPVRNLKVDLVYANLNPNAATHMQNPNRSWVSLDLDRRGTVPYAGGDLRVPRRVDKFQQFELDGNPAHTTEGCFHPCGVYEIRSLGRLVDGLDVLRAEASATAVVRIFQVLHRTTQRDFVGVNGDQGLRANVQSYPEFDPTSTYDAANAPGGGYWRHDSAIWDGQMMLATRNAAAGPAWAAARGIDYYAGFPEDADHVTDDWSSTTLDPATSAPYAVIRTGFWLQQHLWVREAVSEQVVVENSGFQSKSLTVAEFDYRFPGSLLPDGTRTEVQTWFMLPAGPYRAAPPYPADFVASGRGTVMYWVKPITDNFLNAWDLLPPYYHDATWPDDYMRSYWHELSSGGAWTKGLLRIGEDNAFEYQYRGSTGVVSKAVYPAAIRRGEWALIACTWAGTDQRLYVNGAQRDRVSFSGLQPGVTQSAFNMRATNNGNWRGYATLDEIRVSDALLDAFQVSAEYLDGRYERTGSFTSAVLPLSPGARLLDVRWTEFVPRAFPLNATQRRDCVRVEVLRTNAAGTADVSLGIYADADVDNRIGLAADFVKFRAHFDASGVPAPLVDTPVLDDVEITALLPRPFLLQWEEGP